MPTSANGEHQTLGVRTRNKLIGPKGGSVEKDLVQRLSNELTSTIDW